MQAPRAGSTTATTSQVWSLPTIASGRAALPTSLPAPERAAFNAALYVFRDRCIASGHETIRNSSFVAPDAEFSLMAISVLVICAKSPIATECAKPFWSRQRKHGTIVPRFAESTCETSRVSTHEIADLCSDGGQSFRIRPLANALPVAGVVVTRKSSVSPARRRLFCLLRPQASGSRLSPTPNIPKQHAMRQIADKVSSKQ